MAQERETAMNGVGLTLEEALVILAHCQPNRALTPDEVNACECANELIAKFAGNLVASLRENADWRVSMHYGSPGWYVQRGSETVGYDLNRESALRIADHLNRTLTLERAATTVVKRTDEVSSHVPCGVLTAVNELRAVLDTED